ncbi:MAG: histidine kinase dimerization/phospho-acceptor domain-containing protein, partial [Myxococcota bacterium]
MAPRRKWPSLGIRARLLTVNLVVLLVPVAGLEFARLYERQLLGALQRDMRNQAMLVRELLEQDLAKGVELGAPAHQSWLVASARSTRTRIRIIDDTTTAVLDSHVDGPPEGPEPESPSLLELDKRGSSSRDSRSKVTWPQVGERREVRSALEGRPDAFTRVRARDPQVLLFLAEPIRFDGGVVGVVYVTRSTQPVLVELYRIRTGLITVLIVALTFTVVITLLFAASISRPLSRLSQAAQRITRGERAVDVPVGGAREIRELGRAFATMTQRLNERLRATSEFAADVAHELKSPLTSIRGAAELLREDGGAAAPRFLTNIELDADRMDRLVSRLLVLSRIEADESPFGAVALGELLERVRDRTHSDE